MLYQLSQEQLRQILQTAHRLSIAGLNRDDLVDHIIATVAANVILPTNKEITNG